MRCPNRALLWHLNASWQLLRKVFAIVALSVSETYEKIIGRNIFTHQKERGFEMLLDNLTCSVCETQWGHLGGVHNAASSFIWMKPGCVLQWGSQHIALQQ